MKAHDLIPRWPYNITLTENGIYDATQNNTHYLNSTGHFLCSHVDGKRSVREIADKLRIEYSIDKETAVNDTFSFFYDLNSIFLINFYSQNKISLLPSLPIIKAAFYSILYLDIESFIKNWKQSGLTYRLNFSMDGVSKGIQSFLNIVILILLRVQVLWTIPFVALTSSIFILMLSSDNSPEKLLSLLIIYFCLALLIFFGLIIGLAVHEFGHGLMWVWFSKSKEMTIAINFSSVKVICSSRSPKDEIIISLFGPALNILIFVAIAIITLIFPWSFFTKLALLSFAIGAGVFCVSLLGGDGRLIRDRIIRIRMNEK